MTIYVTICDEISDETCDVICDEMCEEICKDDTGAKGSEGGHAKGASRFPHPESVVINERERARRWYRVWEKVHRPQALARKIGRLQYGRVMLVARKVGGPGKCSAFVIRRALLLGALTICRARRWMFRGIFCGGAPPGTMITRGQARLRPIGLEAPAGNNDRSGWVWNTLLDEMVKVEVARALEEASKAAWSGEGLEECEVCAVTVECASSLRHNALLREVVRMQSSKEGPAGGVGIMPVEHECGGHFSLLVRAPGMMLFIDPYGSIRVEDEIVRQTSRAYCRFGIKTEVLGIQFQHHDDVVNCGTWVAVLAGWVQTWTVCTQGYGDGGPREVTDSEEGLVPFLLNLMEKHNVIDCRWESIVGSNCREHLNNSRFIGSTRERFQRALPGRVCNATFEELADGRNGWRERILEGRGGDGMCHRGLLEEEAEMASVEGNGDSDMETDRGNGSEVDMDSGIEGSDMEGDEWEAPDEDMPELEDWGRGEANGEGTRKRARNKRSKVKREQLRGKIKKRRTIAREVVTGGVSRLRCGECPNCNNLGWKQACSKRRITEATGEVKAIDTGKGIDT